MFATLTLTEHVVLLACNLIRMITVRAPRSKERPEHKLGLQSLPTRQVVKFAKLDNFLFQLFRNSQDLGKSSANAQGLRKPVTLGAQ